MWVWINWIGCGLNGCGCGLIGCGFGLIGCGFGLIGCGCGLIGCSCLQANLLCAEFGQETAGNSPLASSNDIADPLGTEVSQPKSAHMHTKVAEGGERGGADGAHVVAIEPDAQPGSEGGERQLSPPRASFELHNGDKETHSSSVSVEGVTMATWDNVTTRSKHKSKVCVRDGDESNGCGYGRSLCNVISDWTICCAVSEAYLVGAIYRLGRGQTKDQ